MHRKRFLTQLICFNLVFVLLLLTGCATTPMAVAPENKHLTWEQRQKNLSALQNWNIKGLIAIHSAKDSFSANLQWQQTGNHYTILVFGPLGANSMKLTGMPGQVLLEMADGRKFHATNAESLLNEQLGWRLPVSNLFYWIRGLPAPHLAAQKNGDVYHHLTTLSQQGWQIQYLQYTQAHQLDLPSKIFLNAPGLSVKIVVSQWDT